MRSWLVVLLVFASSACPRAATENERCTKSADCAATLTCCAGACIDVTRDTRHCGACGAACGAQNAVATCQAGVCRASCLEGFADCNATAADGCEVDLRSAAQHCGACDARCEPASATGACVGGQCAVGACQSGFANCDGRAANGCEVALSSDVMNCGACDARCALPFTSARCLASRCAVGACETGRADCNAQPEDGCEVDTTDAEAHCGGCGMPCAADERCVASQCRVLELFVFGGMATPGDAPTNTVARLQLGQRSFTAVTTTGAAPSPRAFHVATWDVVGSRVLVLGGSSSSGVAAAPDLFAFDPSLTPPAWSTLATTGPGPAALTGMAAGWDRANRRWYVFGGSDRALGGTPTATLSVLDAATLAWAQPAASGATPPARAFASASFDEASARFVLHGGVGAAGQALGDTWVFNPATTTWTAVAMSGPGPRVSSTFFEGASPPVLFGGSDATGAPLTHFDDLWELDPLAGTWTQRAAPNGPAARRWAVGLTLGGVRHLVGGAFDDAQTQTLYNDVWALPWPSRAWQQVRSNAPVGASGVRVGFTVVGREPR
ncbi:MAG: hypothetical protein IAE78_01345 [Myxococcus sp.]|nr:hypothetical protein [Myxococcus sp.]